LEPAKLDCAVLAGPHTFNFTTAYEAVFAAQGYGCVNSTTEIVTIVSKLLADADETCRLGKAAADGAERLGGAVAKTVDVVVKMLDARA
jgi:3-deoxy-D-manno-octulosonic-acid transferase